MKHRPLEFSDWLDLADPSHPRNPRNHPMVKSGAWVRLCPKCYAVVHLRRPARSLGEVARMLERQSK